MFSHITLGITDIARSRAFYDAVFGPLGIDVFHAGPDYAGYGKKDGAQTWILRPFDRKPMAPGNGVHIAYLAPNRAAVDAFWQAALDHGGRDEGKPGLRPHYHPNYYAAYVRDPDGNKLQAVCHSPEG